MRALKFYLNDRYVEVKSLRAEATLLSFLREEQRLIGTKEGCAEGDCGACTLLMGKVTNGQLEYVAVNACIMPMALVDGAHIVTIEALSAGGALHWIQQALVDYHGSQCGFCTPGIVMSLYAMWMKTPAPTRTDIEVALQGNLCRCTGYISIIKGIEAGAGAQDAKADPLSSYRAEMTAKLAALDLADPHLSKSVYSPRTLDALNQITGKVEKPYFVSGATDVGILLTKHFANLGTAVFLGNVAELHDITIEAGQVEIGAAVTYSAAQSALGDVFPELDAYWNVIAGAQIRNLGTIGGNLANGSPIGDMPPVLIALDAKIVLNAKGKRREIDAEDFFLDYRKLDLKAGEIVEKIIVPRNDVKLLAQKVSKRTFEDISTVACAMAYAVEGGVVQGARIAFGGMAATPKRAKVAESKLNGQAFSEETVREAMKALDGEFSPISDMRASAEYRMKVAKNLLLRAVI